MEALCGHTTESEAEETYSTKLPLCEPLPSPIVIPDQQFVITGRFAFGTRRKVFERIEELGRFPTDSAPTRTTNYLVIGVFASRDWYNTNYGRKIERAVELRNSGSGLAIIGEDHWKTFIS